VSQKAKAMNQHLSMSAAIYARKSTDQSGVSDEQRSVARQVEHARSCAARKGWRVLDEHVYIDDGISGAEFERRPGLQRLRAALRPRPAFSVLIVSEQSRLSRDTADTLQLLKELARAGVRVFAYQEDRAISLETPSDTLVTTINAWKDAEGRREASVRTHDALARKARAAHVTGGRVFGYRNVDVFAGVDAHGRPQRSHVTREIREDEAAVVQRIFDLCAAGYGVKRIAAQLNETAAPCPRAQRQRLDGWAASSVRTVLFRTLYRGVVTWNRTKKRNAFGQVQQRPRDPRDWVQVDVAERRIVSDVLWQAAHDRLERARQNYLAGTQGKAWGRPVTGTAAKYLLTGIARCGVCGAGLTVRSRAHGAGRSFRYVCATHHYRGRAICANGLELRQPLADDAVLELLEADILRPSVVEQAIAMALDRLWSEPKTPDRRAAIAQQLGEPFAFAAAAARLSAENQERLKMIPLEEWGRTLQGLSTSFLAGDRAKARPTLIDLIVKARLRQELIEGKHEEVGRKWCCALCERDHPILEKCPPVCADCHRRHATEPVCQSTLARLKREREDAERQAYDQQEKRDAEAAGMSVDQLRARRDAESKAKRLDQFGRLRAQMIGAPSVMDRAS
jgi:site-specific DNA recombinase